MDSALKQISDGVKAVFKGCSMFFAAPPLWPLALIPFTLVLICCGFIVWGGLEFSDWITEDFRHAAAEWPHWLNWIPGTAGVLLDILIILLMIALFIFCSGALYETLGGVFFDRIVEKLFAGAAFSRYKVLQHDYWRNPFSALFLGGKKTLFYA